MIWSATALAPEVVMSRQTIPVLLFAGIIAIAATASATSAGTIYHRKARHLNRPAAAHSAAPKLAGRLVAHPSWSFACMTPYDLSRARPCDQPIWVYGSPCEIGLGLGRWKPCD